MFRQAEGKTRAKEANGVEFEEGLTMSRFRYASVKDLQNTLVAAVICF